jgi:hypothetical protein
VRTDVTSGGRTVRVEFRPAEEPVLVGGPVRLDAVISLLSGDPVELASGSARATGRNRDYTFTARARSGAPLRDPYADAIEIGGVDTSVPLTTDAPVIEEVLLNQFLALESLRDTVPDGGSTELVVRCARQLRLEGLPAETAVTDLRVPMRRDDAALARHYADAAAEVAGTAQFDVHRERLLVELCTARDPLVADALSSLVDHPDGSVAARAAQALTALGQPPS